MVEEQLLVLGATGTVGRRLMETLRRTGHVVRAGSRSGRPRFDWTDRATWGPVLDGVTRLYLLAESGDAAPTDVVRRVTGRPATTFETYAVEAAARGAWRS